jgi:hypothetical protein
VSASLDQPYRGADIDGYRAAVCSGITPNPWRHLRNVSSESMLLKMLIALALLAVGLVGGGVNLAVRGGLATVAGVALVVLGALAGLIGLGLGAIGVWGARRTARHFRDGLLVPGVVVSREPLVLVALADMGKATTGAEHAIARLEPRRLPVHSHEPGTRVPCVARFAEDADADSWRWFYPHPICWGTGDPFEIEQCVARLGDEPFRRLEACVARGPLPSREEEMVILDRNDAFVKVRNIAETASTGGVAGIASGAEFSDPPSEPDSRPPPKNGS